MRSALNRCYFFFVSNTNRINLWLQHYLCFKYLLFNKNAHGWQGKHEKKNEGIWLFFNSTVSQLYAKWISHILFAKHREKVRIPPHPKLMSSIFHTYAGHRWTSHSPCQKSMPAFSQLKRRSNTHTCVLINVKKWILYAKCTYASDSRGSDFIAALGVKAYVSNDLKHLLMWSSNANAERFCCHYFHGSVRPYLNIYILWTCRVPISKSLVVNFIVSINFHKS